MVVFELGNFVYNTPDDEMTIFFNILKIDVSVELLSPSSNDDWSPRCIRKKSLSYATVII